MGALFDLEAAKFGHRLGQPTTVVEQDAFPPVTVTAECACGWEFTESAYIGDPVVVEEPWTSHVLDSIIEGRRRSAEKLARRRKALKTAAQERRQAELEARTNPA